MVITQLEGKVSSDKWDMLMVSFDKALENIPAAIKHSYLVQDNTDKEIWRMITVWYSREALQNYRQSVETPEGILMFRAVGTEPTLTISEVHQSS